MTLVDVHLAGVSFRAHEQRDARYGAFWAALADGGFEPATVAVLREHLGPGRTFVDVGAWIGPFTLLAAALGADVVAYEVDPTAAAELRANVDANADLAAHVDVRARAVAARSGPVALDGGGVGLGNGLTRIRRRRGGADDGAATAEADGADVLMADERVARAALVKIDIEGAEFAVVPRLAPWLAAARPALLLSLHGVDPATLTGGRGAAVVARVRGVPARLRLLWALRRYPRAWRAESNRSATWRPLSMPQRWLLALRLGEIELYFRATDR